MCMQNSHIQKNTRRTCIKHFVCITLLNYFCDKYPPLNHHHQSRHHRSVQNLSLRHNFFKKIHHSIQLHTPTDPSIRLMPHVLWVRHHERGFYLQYHHSNSIPHLPLCLRVRGHLPESPYGVLLVPINKEFVQPEHIFNHTPHLLTIQPVYNDSSWWPWFPPPHDQP